MSVGAFFDQVIYIACGIMLLYVAKKNKEKLGGKAKRLTWGGIAFLLLAFINIVSRLVK